MRTEEEILQDLHASLVELAILRGVGDEGDAFNDWVFVGQVSNMLDSDKDGYITLTQRGVTPSHITFGLLHEAKKRFEGQRG